MTILIRKLLNPFIERYEMFMMEREHAKSGNFYMVRANARSFNEHCRSMCFYPYHGIGKRWSKNVVSVVEVRIPETRTSGTLAKSIISARAEYPSWEFPIGLKHDMEKDEWSFLVGFSDAKDAMLFKLAHGGAA